MHQIELRINYGIYTVTHPPKSSRHLKKIHFETTNTLQIILYARPTAYIARYSCKLFNIQMHKIPLRTQPYTNLHTYM